MSDQKQIDKGRAAAVRAGMGPWFRRASTHGPLIAGLLVLSGGAPAVATDEVISEMKVGVMSHDVSVLGRSEEHTSELQSLMRISYAVFCLKKKTNTPFSSVYTSAEEKTHAKSTIK